MKRRTLLSATGITGAALVGSQILNKSNVFAQSSGYSKPNILVIVVDQLRTPQWFPDQATLDTYLPNLAALRKSSVSFSQFYTAATACTPARGAFVTGLYSHQTYLFDTALFAVPDPLRFDTPNLNPGFPTWGKLLRENFGYNTWWFGKWHLSDSSTLEPYGFSGGTYPSPNGAPGQGLDVDPYIFKGGPNPPDGIEASQQFAGWINSRDSQNTPWCTTVSFINPHDIAWYPRGTDQIALESHPPSVFSGPLPNFETPSQLATKPRIQEAFREATNLGVGFLPPNYGEPWLKLLDSYLLFQRFVDKHIGQVLQALQNSPYAQNTIVVFTSDHGEYGGSHGLRGKSGAVYEEAIRVPLYVKDPTGQWINQPGTRNQLASSVDIVPLLLTLAQGNNEWRNQPQFQHLSTRLDIAQILRNSQASGRPYILNTTDELLLSLAGNILSLGKIPGHIIGYRTNQAKLGAYNFWRSGTTEIDLQGMESELYDYSTDGGRLELENVSRTNSVLYSQLVNQLFNDVIPNELRKPLTYPALVAAQQQALQDYLVYANHLTTYVNQIDKTNQTQLQWFGSEIAQF